MNSVSMVVFLFFTGHSIGVVFCLLYPILIYTNLFTIEFTPSFFRFIFLTDKHHLTVITYYFSQLKKKETVK